MARPQNISPPQKRFDNASSATSRRSSAATTKLAQRYSALHQSRDLHQERRPLVSQRHRSQERADRTAEAEAVVGAGAVVASAETTTITTTTTAAMMANGPRASPMVEVSSIQILPRGPGLLQRQGVAAKVLRHPESKIQSSACLEGQMAADEGVLDLPNATPMKVDSLSSMPVINLYKQHYQPPPTFPASWTTLAVSDASSLPTSLITSR